ncbi:hypothetical protein GQ55_4G274500 [Panicum hallii var. hallii]|uniref:Uncharacterized protein n=1 Tax=Panicum hallii var. hallii TaxID=1504633 RepID=A0A2T7E0S4_9POAL|nr:hypothetical protein GQ55_4G274500 [Panicum hallii var. hallii]
MLLLRRHLLPLLRAASPLPSPIHRRACPLLSTSASAAPFSFEDYLVAACGLSPAQAGKTAQKAVDETSRHSKKAFEDLSRSRLKSASNPDAILAFLSGVGLSRTDIAVVVAADPLLLRCSVKTIGPRLLALRDCLGLSAPQVVRFLLVGSRSLHSRSILPTLQFLISFYGSFEQALVAAKRNRGLLHASLEKTIEPKVALFRQFGVRDIAKLCSNNPKLLTFSLERVQEFLLRAEELGVPRNSQMFKYAVAVVACNSREKVAAKIEFFKRTLGCSESEVSIAVFRQPSILGVSDEKHIRKFEFLVNEVGMGPRYILERPYLFALSLEKRLLPRHRVLKVLQAKGLLNSKMSFTKFVTIGEKAFRLRFIDPHKDSVPGLAGYYTTACAGGVPPEVQLSS